MSGAHRGEAHSLVEKRLAEDPGAVLEQLAAEHGLTAAEAVECLPQEMVRRVGPEHFVPILEEVHGWGTVTLIVHTEDVILEARGVLPQGRSGHGFYNLHGEGGPIGGHIRADRCAGIYFVSRPFMGQETHSIQFYNRDGGGMFKVFLGRDAERRIDASQLSRYRALRDRLSPATPGATP